MSLFTDKGFYTVFGNGASDTKDYRFEDDAPYRLYGLVGTSKNGLITSLSIIRYNNDCLEA